MQVDLTFYFIYRILELGSRTSLLALFTVSNMLAALLRLSLCCAVSVRPRLRSQQGAKHWLGPAVSTGIIHLGVMPACPAGDLPGVDLLHRWWARCLRPAAAAVLPCAGAAHDLAQSHGKPLGALQTMQAAGQLTSSSRAPNSSAVRDCLHQNRCISSDWPGQKRTGICELLTTAAQNGTCRLQVPRPDDVKLLLFCLLWPPSCFVSDATDKQGGSAPLRSEQCLLAQASTQVTSMRMQVNFGGELECQAGSQWVALACRASSRIPSSWR